MDLTAAFKQLFKQRQGYSHWRNILHFYEEHKDNLTDKQKKRIINRSEKYRLEHNRDSNNHNDKIRKQDIYPNIYLS